MTYWISLDKEIAEFMLGRTGDSMPKDPLDRPITLRELVDAMPVTSPSLVNASVFRRTVNTLVKNTEQTDFVKVQFSGEGWGRYTYRIAEMPTRRIQVGDLVTTQSFGIGPTVARVVEINVPAPEQSNAVAVAISPEDAARIEKALGKVGP